MANPIIPQITTPFIGPGEGRTDSAVAFLALSSFIVVPKVVVVGTPFETPPLFSQGFTTFQGEIDAVAGSTLKVEYGICHPITFAVLGYRTVAAAVATGTGMIATWGKLGQTTPALQGDLFTAFTVRLTASGANATINEMVIWFAVR